MNAARILIKLIYQKAENVVGDSSIRKIKLEGPRLQIIIGLGHRHHRIINV